MVPAVVPPPVVLFAAEVVPGPFVPVLAELPRPPWFAGPLPTPALSVSEALGTFLLNSRCAIAFSSKSFRYDRPFDTAVREPGPVASRRGAKWVCRTASASGMSPETRCM